MKRKNHSHFIPKLISGWLVLFLIFINLLQAFHQHHETTVSVDKTAQGEEVLTDNEQCAICDFAAHQRHEVFYISSQVDLPVPLPAVITLNGSLQQRIYKFTLQGFSNKGPPIQL
ncbi:hypothetical protein LPB86_13050 [Pedobacter sp. MC2016-14]|uniref:hypothetical protein n=1 Tax=Pedobacter sp. MC2016-14 TaxID=2897327 RepID=UPI001E2B6E39|nr:hypothetical protein [Pedobacter sp. MC2016-14]MCD0489161.1 hypothetical protein [Pedobacter sp. MC2016-14]